MQFTDRFVCSSWRPKFGASKKRAKRFMACDLLSCVGMWCAFRDETVLARKLRQQFACQDVESRKFRAHRMPTQDRKPHAINRLARFLLSTPTAANEPVSELHSFVALRWPH